MERRMFLGAMGGLGASALGRSATESGKMRFYVLEQMFLRNGSQLPRLHEFASGMLLPALNRLHSGPKLYLEALVAPHMPQFAALYGFESLDDIRRLHAKTADDAELMKQSDAFESGPEAPFESQTNTLIEAADYSPEMLAAEPNAAPRLFELRTYHSPTWRQLKALHERFSGSEVKIFHRSGIHPVLYGTTLFGADMPNLTYVIPFENLAAREKAWGAFGADPEWVKVRKESIEKHGQISSVIRISIYKAAPYSPVR
jgi:NIPSNAP